MGGYQDPSELVVGGTGEIYVAPVGTTLPVNPVSAPNAAFVGLGLTTEDGVSLTVDPTIQEFMAWQSSQPVRRERTALGVSAAFTLEQFNEDTVKLAFGGGTISTVSAGVYKYTPPSVNDALDERAMVIDILDGAEHHRWVFPRGNASESVTSAFQRGALSVLPVTFKGLAASDDPNGPPFYYYTDSDAFAAGS